LHENDFIYLFYSNILHSGKRKKQRGLEVIENMALVSGGRSTLNPNAPLFIPAAFRRVEDFSPEWWQLVTTSTWYHDYWLSQHQGEDGFYENGDQDDINGVNLADLLPEAFEFDDDGDDFSNMETQFEEFLQFYENKGVHVFVCNIAIEKNPIRAFDLVFFLPYFDLQ